MKLSLRWTLVFSFILLVWSTHFLITPIFYITSKDAYAKHMREVLSVISDLTLQRCYNYLDKAQESVAIDLQLLGSNVVSSQIEGSSALERSFFDQLLSHPYLNSIYVGGLNGNFFMVSRDSQFLPNGFQTKLIRNDKGTRTVKHIWRDSDYMLFHYIEDPADTYDPRTQIWFAEGLAYEHLIWTDPYILPTTNKPGISFTGQVNNLDKGLVGVVGVDIELSDLSEFIKQLRVGKSGKAFIINHNGDIIALDGLEKGLTLSESDDALKLPTVYDTDNIVIRKAFQSMEWQQDSFGDIQLNEPVISKLSHEGSNYLAMFTPFQESELPWIIGVYLPEDDYLSSIKKNQRYNLMATIFISLVASIFGYFLAKKIATPVDRLAKAASEIEHQEIDNSFHLTSSFKEIQNTADTFARMKVSLSNYRKQLLESENIYRAITEKANDAIIMINSNNVITFFNPSAEKMFGYTSEEILGRKLPEILDPEQEPYYEKNISQLLDKGSEIQRDNKIQIIGLTKNGQGVPVELSLSTFMLENTLHAVAIVRNITDRMKAANMRKRLVNDLHDGVGGNITNIKLLAEIAQAHDVDANTANILEAVIDMCRDSINEIRNYMNLLDDRELSWKNFAAEIHNHFATTLEAHNINFLMNVEISEQSPSPSNLLYMNVYKIIKEAVNNVIKHSNGDTMELDMQIREHDAELSIRDNGYMNNIHPEPGKGLLSMQSRASELNGIIDFSWGKGACLTLNIPFTRTTVHEKALQIDSQV